MVCLLLCLHAYFIFNVRDEAVQTSVSADTKLGGWGGGRGIWVGGCGSVGLGWVGGFGAMLVVGVDMCAWVGLISVDEDGWVWGGCWSVDVGWRCGYG